MAETAFGVTYDGPALANGRMPVRDLAPALLALGDVFAEASAALYPDQEPVALNIKATAEGSFDVHLILEATGLWDQVVDLLNRDAADALANLMQLIGGSYGLFAFIRTIRRRRIKKREETTPGYIKLTLEDDETIEIRAEVFDLYRNLQVRQQVRRVVEPLARDGVDLLELRSEAAGTVSIGSGDVSAFEPPELHEIPLLDRTTEMVVAIVSVAFKEDNKWRLTDGERTFFATIEDYAFLERVTRGFESFRNGDMLKCKMRIVQSRDEEGLHTAFHVLKVIQHIPREIQLPFADLDLRDTP
jgi:hypothetical protein